MREDAAAAGVPIVEKPFQGARIDRLHPQNALGLGFRFKNGVADKLV
jgi:hypothetical protein